MTISVHYTFLVWQVHPNGEYSLALSTHDDEIAKQAADGIRTPAMIERTPFDEPNTKGEWVYLNDTARRLTQKKG